MLAKGTETPFKANVVLVGRLVLDEACILLVNCIISQMHVLVGFVDLLSVGFRCKPCQSLLIDINFKRLVTSD